MSGSSKKSSKKRRTTPADDDDADQGAAAAASEEEPQALLTRIREETQAELAPQRGRGQRGHHDVDLPLLVKIVRALVATNGEIWDTCKASQQDKAPNSYRRVIYRSIEVSGLHQTLQFEVTSTHEIRHDFHVPTISEIPEKLASIISVVPMEEDPMLPDYEKYFRTALLLHEDIMLPFLNVFKAHLEELQVALGEIDTWLMESKSCVNFINDQFSVDLQELELELQGCSSSCDKGHDPSAVCFNCGKRYNFHDKSTFGYATSND